MRYNIGVKCLFLYNPNSGRGKIARKLPYIRRRLGEVYSQVDIYATTSGEDMEQRAREGAMQGYDLILFAGGDGTFNNVLQGIEGSDTQLGYLPAGTANDVARSLHIPRSVRGALNVVFEGKSAQLDCMRVNGSRYVVYVAALGSFVSVTYETSQKKKRAFGYLAYVFALAKKLFKMQTFSVKITCGEETHELKSPLVLVMNGRRVGGFPANRRASMQDGRAEIAVIRQEKKPNFFRNLGVCFAIASILLGGRKRSSKRVTLFRGERFFISTDSASAWDFDGEKGVCGDVDIEVVPRHVKLFVPAGKKI